MATVPALDMPGTSTAFLTPSISRSTPLAFDMPGNTYIPSLTPSINRGVPAVYQQTNAANVAGQLWPRK
jgi:hypothetical protein